MKVETAITNKNFITLILECKEIETEETFLIINETFHITGGITFYKFILVNHEVSYSSRNHNVNRINDARIIKSVG